MRKGDYRIFLGILYIFKVPILISIILQDFAEHYRWLVYCILLFWAYSATVGVKMIKAGWEDSSGKASLERRKLTIKQLKSKRHEPLTAGKRIIEAFNFSVPFTLALTTYFYFYVKMTPTAFISTGAIIGVIIFFLYIKYTYERERWGDGQEKGSVHPAKKSKPQIKNAKIRARLGTKKK